VKGISFRDVHGIADELGVDVQTVRRWIQSGRLRAFKPGKEYRVRETDLEEFLAAREVRPKAVTPPSQRSLFNGGEEERRSKASPTAGEISAIRRWLSYLEQTLIEGNLAREEIAHDLDAARAFGIGKDPALYPSDLVGDFLQIVRRALEEGKSFDTLQNEFAGLEADMDQLEEVYAEAKEQQT
jgi:excisionase family DNA binding protein